MQFIHPQEHVHSLKTIENRILICENRDTLSCFPDVNF